MRTKKPTLAIDQTIALDVNGSRQWVRLCAVRTGLPPLVIVQHGPGVPVLHEVAKFQRRLHLERDYLVVYWEQRGCGNASAEEARRVSLAQQVQDLQTVLRWIGDRTQQRVLVFGISLGATISLLAAAREGARVKAVIANSPDLQTRAGDAAVDAFLRAHARRAGTRRLRRALTKLGPPPYLDPRAFQRRAVLLADFDSIERGRTFNALLRETLVAMVRTYGVLGTVRALRNMNIVQRMMLGDVATLDLLARPPTLAVPVHFVFGEQDALTAAFLSSELPAAIGAPGTTAVRVANAGHLVHFDRPDVARSIAAQA
ncbi:MAG TPA: alpha/beta hydrolase [Vicinamibacterales bacterium]|jgi:pimeloyl-ACP methyl ester carboxylesterase